jgi:ribonuclease VapC
MFIDTSAVVACICEERDNSKIFQALKMAPEKFTSPMVRLESSIVIARKMDCSAKEAEELFDDFVFETELLIIDITDEIGSLAVEAYGKFGKGRHPAKLNLADCFSYAAAKHLKVPILFVGSDFSKTDLKSAL